MRQRQMHPWSQAFRIVLLSWYQVSKPSTPFLTSLRQGNDRQLARSLTSVAGGN